MSSAAESHLNNLTDGIREFSRRQLKLVGAMGELHSVRTAVVLPTPAPRLTPFQEVIDSMATPATVSTGEYDEKATMSRPALSDLVAEASEGSPSARDDSASATAHTQSVFDDVFAAVSDPRSGVPEHAEVLPPPSRFMVRVAPLEQPHRKTKRNYDYFRDLDEKLASRAAKGLSQQEA